MNSTTPFSGSLTAHSSDIWDEMLTKAAIAILTPWRKGRGRLPDEDGIRAITALSPHSFSSSRNGATRPKTRSPAVQSYLRATGIQLRNLNVPTGFIRMRKKPGSDWKIELFGPASRTSNKRERTRERNVAPCSNTVTATEARHGRSAAKRKRGTLGRDRA
jgi:hypothetical protein